MRSGFSLVELSIVLVILGLLTGGILAGQNLIRAAELRNVSTDLQKYHTAMYTFRDKYFALPGDMTNATDFWGTMATGTCPDATAGTGTQTCNGNGNGNLSFSTAALRTGETFMFWQHLANAGLIEGTYTGIAGSTTFAHVVPGTNAPLSKSGKNSAFSVAYANTGTGAGLVFLNAPAGNRFQFGSIFSTNVDGDQPTLIAEEAWNIDTKIDDGKPGLGKLMTYKNTSRANCASTDDRTTAVYLLSSTVVGCNIYYMF